MALENSFNYNNARNGNHKQMNTLFAASYQPEQPTLNSKNPNTSTTNSASLKMPVPSSNLNFENLLDMVKGNLTDPMKSPKDKADTLVKVLADPAVKRSPAMTNNLIKTAIESTQDVDKATIIGTLMKDKDLGNTAAKVMQDMKPEALSLNGADLRDMPKAVAEALPYNLVDVRNAKLPAGLNLADNKYMNGVNLDGVTAPLMKLPANANIISAKNANVRQDAPVTDAQITNVAVLTLAGANTSQVMTNSKGSTITMANVKPSTGLEGVKAGIAPKHDFPTPSPFAPPA